MGDATRPSRWAALLVAAVGFGFAEGSAKAQDGYQLGHGYDLGPFNLAGYSDVTANFPDGGRKSLSLEDLSLFVSGHITSWLNPFVEAELTHLELVSSGPSQGDGGDGSLVLERLYNDVDFGSGLTLRLGKMLTPVGEWNGIHAAPLVLSTVRPAVTYQNFTEYLTGATLLFSDPNGSISDIEVYWQPDKEFSERPSSIRIDEYRQVEGLHVKFPLSLLDQVGFSLQRSHDTLGVVQTLAGLDFQYRVDRTTFQGEWSYSDLSGQTSTLARRHEWGGYLAVSQALDQHWSVYGWYENFARRSTTASADDLLFGVAFRPDPAIVFKLEYLQNIGGSPVNPTGLFASWSVLF
jgi:hypothetical protein